MVGPWLNSLWKSGKTLSDIEFLSIKEFDGKIVSNEGHLSATGDLATLTASGSKDMYLAKAKVSFVHDGVGTSGATVELSINGVVKETTQFDGAVIAGSTPQPVNYDFINMGRKVATTQIIKLEVTAIGTGDEIEGTVLCFEEATGASPAI